MEQPSQLSCPKWINIFFLLLYIGGVSAQSTIHIRVLDECDHPLSFVHIINQTTQSIHVTDEAGQVQIPYSSTEDHIQCRYLGYEMVVLSVEQLLLNKGLIQLLPSPYTNPTATVIGRMGLKQEELPYEIININSNKITSVASANTADVLAQAAGVFVQKSQGGGGSPILRGFEANRLLLVVDGTRLNNTIYRSGHLHNALSVDPATIERIEVILGPNALLYGSDALGGVLHFKTKSPIFPTEQQKIEWNAQTRITSATREKTLHVDRSWASAKHRFLTGFTYSDLGDITSGKRADSAYADWGKRIFYVSTIQGRDSVVPHSDPYLQKGTAYRQWHFIQKWNYFISDNIQLKSQYQFSSSSDIPRYDQLNITKDGLPKWADWHYGPLRRSLASITYANRNTYAWANKMQIIASAQGVSEERVQRKLYHLDESHQLEDLNIFSLTGDFQKPLHFFTESELSYGMDVQYERLQSEAFSRNILNDARTTTGVLTRYPDGSNTSLQGGVYALVNASLFDQLKIQGGARWSMNQIRVQYQDRNIVNWPEPYYEGITNTNQALTGSFGLNWIPKASWALRSLVGTAFRTPNIDDIAKLRIKNGEVLVPNPTLRPEKSRNIECGITKSFPLTKKGQVVIGGTAFLTYLSDAIVRRDFTLPDGRKIWEIEGEPYVISSNVNASNGYIKGISLKATAHHGDHLSAEASFNKVIGRTTPLNGPAEPLAHIPPLYGYLTVQYRELAGPWNTHINGLLRLQYNGAKPVEEYGPNSSDNLEYATPQGTPAWHTWDMGLTLHKNTKWQLQLGANNLLDIKYRPFSSGVNAPGRNLYFGLLFHMNK